MVGSGDEKEDEDLDGVPLDGAALLKSAFMRGIPGAAGTNDSPSLARVQDNADSDYEDDIDGIPRKCIIHMPCVYVAEWFCNKIVLFHAFAPISG